jgi:hypothetical protein
MIFLGAFRECNSLKSIKFHLAENGEVIEQELDMVKFEYPSSVIDDDEGCDMNFPPDWAEESGWNDMYGGGCDPSDFIEYD